MKRKTGNKTKAGRPTSYRKKYCEMLTEHMRGGKSFETFATAVGVARDTLYQWTKRHPEFAEAKTKATELALDFWEDLGIKGATGEKPVNPTIWIFNMKNRFGWRDRKQLEHTGDKPEIKIYMPDNKR